MNPIDTLKKPIAASRSISRWTVTLGDALDILARKADESVDAIVTDPPAGIGFAGHDWDSARGGRDQWITWLSTIFCEGLRVLKPGGHALVWAFPRTSHWTARALDDAGFEIRDCLIHVFATGFAKSLDVSQAIDRAASVARPIVGRSPAGLRTQRSTAYGRTYRPVLHRTGPATKDAHRWAGWGTALRSTSEHWWLVRKPLAERTVAQQVITTGTGAINVGATRVLLPKAANGEDSSRTPSNFLLTHSPLCQMPANDDTGSEIHCADGCPVRALAESGPGGRAPTQSLPQFAWGDGDIWPARYVPKIGHGDRDLADGSLNNHPTVKPVALMRWLCRLVTPPGGLILDPFAGSGTTGVAALEEGFAFDGIESDGDYIRIARARLRQAARVVSRRT